MVKNVCSELLTAASLVSDPPQKFTCTYIRTSIHICTCSTYICTYINTRIHTYIHAHIYVCACACLRARMCVRARVCAQLPLKLH
jgi:hypothetical protein